MNKILLLLASTLTATNPALAAGFQDTAAIDRAVSQFVGHAIGEDGGARTPVDARLRLGQCPTVSLAWRSDLHDAVVVSCTGPDWRIFVAVHSIVVASSPLPITGGLLPKAEAVIKRGDPVVIEAGTDGFTISREGIAMGDAAPGVRFLVKVDETRTPVQAIAVASGRATLPGWSN